MLYTLRAYESRKQGESGKTTPLFTIKTGSFVSAEQTAKELADHYGACVVANYDTGNRTWFIRA